MEQFSEEHEPITQIQQIFNSYVTNDFIAFAFFVPMRKMAIGLGEQMDETISRMRGITHKEIDRFWDSVKITIDTGKNSV